MTWRRLPWPRGLAAQIAACVIVALVVSQLLTTILVVLHAPRGEPPPAPHDVATRIALIITAIDAVPPADRRRLAEALQQPDMRIETAVTPDLASGPEPPATIPYVRQVQERLGQRFPLKLARSGTPPQQRVVIDALLGDGATVRIETALQEPPGIVAFGTREILFYLPFLTIAIAILTLWATRRVTAPLRAFSNAAERLGNERSAPPLPERGPAELQKAARSFNRMQDQIKRFIDERTRSLAAISHDLRTPITRLKLRVEAVDNVEERRRMLRDLDRMEGMLSSALVFLRDGARDEPVVSVDLASILQSVCDGFSDMGYEVRYIGLPALAMRGRPELLGRAITNLVENAAKHASVTTVDLARGGDGSAVVQIDDDGPGIPDEEKAKAFDAFYRLDEARSAESGGFGLGLSIVKAIVELHGGRIDLTDSVPSGLRVVVSLPVCAPGVAADRRPDRYQASQ